MLHVTYPPAGIMSLSEIVAASYEERWFNVFGIRVPSTLTALFFKMIFVQRVEILSLLPLNIFQYSLVLESSMFRLATL